MRVDCASILSSEIVRRLLVLIEIAAQSRITGGEKSR
jgi:hypothetical protein